MRPPAFQFYVDNFIEGTVDMTDAEVGLYIRLLCAQWSRGGLPNDDSELLRFSRAGSVQPSLNRIKAKFRICDDGKLRNDRMERERAKQVSYRETQSAKGKASAQARLRLGSTAVQPEGEPKVNFPSPSPSPIFAERESADRPSEQEVLFYAQKIGLAEWKARDWFQEMEGCGWIDHNRRPIHKWQSVIARVRTKWEADGRPMGPLAAKAPPRGKSQGPEANQIKENLTIPKLKI